jgi:murein DD-endopeptidase MepM/ murein hydrolase activator NlpD
MRSGKHIRGLVLVAVLAAFAAAPIIVFGEVGQEPELRLIGIAIFQGRATALVEDRAAGSERFYEEGDALGEYVVKRIESKRVVLVRDGAELSLPLFDTPDGTLDEADQEEGSSSDLVATKHAKELKQAVRQTAKTRFLIPVEGEIGSAFGYRQHPMGGGRQFHRGVDIVAPYGKSVRATADGIVTFASRRWGLGKSVVLQHSEGWSSVYGHLSRIVVSVGEKVQAGQTIGYVGNTGISTGPHLHFELHKQGVAVNPASYVPLGK